MSIFCMNCANPACVGGCQEPVYIPTVWIVDERDVRIQELEARVREADLHFAEAERSHKRAWRLEQENARLRAALVTHGTAHRDCLAGDDDCDEEPCNVVRAALKETP